MKKITLAACLFATSSYSFAGFYDGNKLNEWADADDHATESIAEARKAAKLQGYVTGVHDAGENAQIYCAPDQMKVSQLVAVVKKHIRAHPETWNQPADILIVRALRLAFPCKK